MKYIVDSKLRLEIQIKLLLEILSRYALPFKWDTSNILLLQNLKVLKFKLEEV